MANGKDRPVEIVGAGPAGLVAALTLARNGYRAVVHELRPDVGHRFHGDFQGLENWSTKEDVIDLLGRMGIKINFPCHPYTGG
jgi:flavin-dependent dehydrogenase